MIHTAALHIPRKMDEWDSVEEQIICVCGEQFKRESELTERFRELVYISAADQFAQHLREENQIDALGRRPRNG